MVQHIKKSRRNRTTIQIRSMEFVSNHILDLMACHPVSRILYLSFEFGAYGNHVKIDSLSYITLNICHIYGEGNGTN